LAKQTEINLESTQQLTDINAAIAAESARLAVDYNKTVLSSSASYVDIVARIFDNKIMRDFEAAKNEVMLSLEGFKASIQVLVANAELEGKYMDAISTHNESVVKTYTGEIDGAVAALEATTKTNASKVDSYESQVKAAITAVTTVTDANQATAAAYSAAVAGATADVQGQAESARSSAMVDEISSRKAIGIAGLSKDLALANIDAATRKYLGDVQVLNSASQGAMQLVAASLNGVSASSSLGWSGSYGYSENVTSETTTP
jgi:hypothetical protein